VLWSMWFGAHGAEQQHVVKPDDVFKECASVPIGAWRRTISVAVRLGHQPAKAKARGPWAVAVRFIVSGLQRPQGGAQFAVTGRNRTNGKAPPPKGNGPLPRLPVACVGMINQS
jgi:hypothetical protein